MWKRMIPGLGAGLALILTFAAQAAKIDINTADEAALAEGIVGVGPSIASEIVVYRQKNGPFESVDDLVGVRGIGEKILERNRDNLTVETSSN